jgi:uncharacterized membrane protein
MIIFCLILLVCFIILCLIGVIVSIRDGEWGVTVFAFLLGLFLSILLFADIDAIRRDNTRTVEYYFPADHYTFEQIITETSETKYIGNDTLVVVKRDTTYKLVGQDPIIGGDNHFNRKYPD